MKKKTNNNLDTLIEKLEHVDLEINATHLNYINGNSLLYTTDAAKSGGTSWIKPYAKPQLLHHDKHRDAVGRVMNYSIESSSDEKGEPDDYIKLSVRITDKEAISKVIKGIYYTCSVGSATSRVRCSACNQVLTVDGLCEHEKGSMVEGKRVYWIVDNISYKENSFVNNPADSYSRITTIDIGNGPIKYEKFLNDKETVLTQFFMEDTEMNKQNQDAKLSTEARNKLPDSAFCGPGRSFPAHDKAHVTAGLRLLNKSDFSQSTKDKIKACLYRKGKQYGITPQEDELRDHEDFISFRLNDDFTSDEVKAIADFFTENPDADLPTQNDFETNNDEQDLKVDYTINDYETIKKSKKEDILSYCDWLVGEFTNLNDTISELNKTEKELNDKITTQDTILVSKEDEIQKLLNDNAELTSNYRRALIDNVLDLKKITDNRDEEFKKFESRKIDSLVDTITDYRNEPNLSIPKVNDETLKDSTGSEKHISDEQNKPDSQMSKIDRFFRHNILNNMEE